MSNRAIFFAGFRSLAAVFVFFTTTGCFSASIRSDIDRVTALTKSHADADNDVVSHRDDDDLHEPPLDVRTGPEHDDVDELLSNPLDVEAAVHIALVNNRGLKQRLRELGIARGDLIDAGLLPNPTVEVELLPERNTEVEVRVEYDLKDALMAPLKSRAEHPNLEAARYRAAAAVVELTYDVRRAFYTLEASMEKLKLHQRVLDAVLANRDATRALSQAGNVADLDVARAEVTFERERLEVANQELTVATNRETLHRLLGLHGSSTSWTADEKPYSLPKTLALDENNETRALKASYALREARQRLEMYARTSRMKEVDGWIPDFSVDVHGLQGDPTNALSFTNVASWRVGGGITVGLPVFDRNQGTVRKLDAEFDSLMERYYGVAVDTRSEVRAAQNRVRSAFGRSRHLVDVVLPAQRRVADETAKQYNAMQLGMFQLMNARRDVIVVELDVVDTILEYRLALLELDTHLAGVRTMPQSDVAGVRTTASESGDHP